jgi:hypothetical protein
MTLHIATLRVFMAAKMRDAATDKPLANPHLERERQAQLKAARTARGTDDTDRDTAEAVAELLNPTIDEGEER